MRKIIKKQMKTKKLDSKILVDVLLYPQVNQYTWGLYKGYARTAYNNGRSSANVIGLHQFVWFIYFGEVLDGSNGYTIDHINGNGLDNRLINLRPANKSLQALNRGIQSNNKTGYRGVHFDKTRNRYKAEIKKNNKKHFLGRFKTAEEAAIAYEKAFKELHTYTQLLNRND